MHDKKITQGLLVVLSSPSGAGKTSLASSIVSEHEEVVFSVSATTRPPRIGEIEGREYYFVKTVDFKAMIKNGDFIEYAEVFGNFYGSPKKDIQELIECGKDVIFDVDWQGGTQIRNSNLASSVVSIFILPPSIRALEERLLSRAQDDKSIVDFRMLEARSEISHWAEYDYVLINDNFSRVKGAIVKIIETEKMRRQRQLTLPNFIADLNDEFDVIKNKI
ncbi:MAG: guanylate kinase [Pseudomonadota bacterium]|nr:guanylate kinase [Pseudomonadota bacterium]